MANEIVVIKFEFELQKILAFVRARVRGKKFLIAPELVDTFLQRLETWAHENDLRIAVELIDASGTKTLVFGACGAVAGAATGFWLSKQPVGAVVGAIAGGVAGVALAHTRIRFTRGDVGPDNVLMELV